MTAGMEDLRSLTAAQVSELTGIKVKTLYAWRSRGEGPPSFKVQGVVLFPAEGLRKYLEAEQAATAVAS